jgi:signal transduction histidine kinase
MIGHEFNTPIHGIEFFTKMISKKSNQLQDSDLKEYSNYLELSTKRLRRTFSKVQLFYKLNNSGYLKYASTEINNINNFLKNCGNETAKRFERLWDLKYNLNGNVGINIDIYLFKILIDEIIENAFKFSKPISEVEILTSLETSNNIFITVSDKGSNTDASRISHMTEFNQFDRNSQEQQGLGIGIILVKKIAKILGIKISFENNSPQGLIVRIVVPK